MNCYYYLDFGLEILEMTDGLPKPSVILNLIHFPFHLTLYKFNIGCEIIAIKLNLPHVL